MPSGPTVYLTASACPHNSSRKTRFRLIDRTPPQMTRPLGSTPTAPSRGFTATASRSAGASTQRYSLPCGSAAWQTPSRHRLDHRRQCRDTPSHVPHKSSRPDSRRLHAGHHLARNTDTRQTPPGLATPPGFDVTLLGNDMSTAIPENEDCAAVGEVGHLVISGQSLCGPSTSFKRSGGGRPEAVHGRVLYGLLRPLRARSGRCHATRGP
jgi:hypothetical protein